MTPITYREAVEILGIVEGSLHHAVSRGVLTRLPREGLYQHLIKEQVELFKGKRLSLSSLSGEKRLLWQKYHDAVTIPIHEQQLINISQPEYTPSNIPSTPPVYLMDKATVEHMYERGLGMRMAQTATGETIFHPALSDEVVSNTVNPLQTSPSLGMAIAILIGLLVLLFVLSREKVKASIQAEQTIEKIGLAKEDVKEYFTSGGMKAATVLSSHPAEINELKALLKRENLLPVA